MSDSPKSSNHPIASQAATAVSTAEVRRLGRSSLIYLVPNVLARGLAFLLAPLYAQTMGPDEYGIVGVAGTLTPLVATAMCLSAHSAIARLHFDLDDDGERKRLYSTVLVFLMIGPAILAALLHVAGTLGMLHVLRTVRFEPHLKLVIWAAVFAPFPSLVFVVFSTREQPATVARFSVVSTMLTAAFAVLFVVVLRQGAIGQLRAVLLSGAVVAALTIWTVVRLAGLSFSWVHLKRALAFSIPLVPHTVANWVLAASDRLVLERWVSQEDLGRYSLGYTFATVTAVVAGAVGMATVPMLNHSLKADDRVSASRLGSYALVSTSFAAVGVATCSPDAIRLLTPISYHAAGSVVPWVVLGLAFQALYTVTSIGTFYSKRTRMVPLVTGVGALANVGLNLALVPRFGILGAAVDTAAAYAIMALLHCLLGQRLHPVPWEYSRWLRLLVVGFAVFWLTRIPGDLQPGLGLAIRGLIVLVGFPLGLVASRFLLADERRALGRILAGLKRC